MLGSLRHRGPDEFGIYLDGRAGLGSARLSILDLQTGQQPISNEDASLWIVFNGEIFNHEELRLRLESNGHRFSTRTDTEVLLHLYEESGPHCLERLNGQFAVAIWNSREHTLFLARDRLGVRPLFYTMQDARLIFGSEIKSIMAAGAVRREIDPSVLDQVFTFWSPLGPRTIFRDILEVPPGSYLLARGDEVTVKNYWQLTFPPSTEGATRPAPTENYVERFRGLLTDAARIRLRADVPVGAYLSGGLDSSTVACIAREFAEKGLDTFSIAFSDAAYDESRYQQRMADLLGTNHHSAFVTHADIARVFPEVVWHTEVPLMRTAPAPMFLLSKLVRDSGFKVVLTGEGADEFLAGYDLFKEASIRRFWAKRPASRLRPLLLKRLYADIQGLAGSNESLLAAFFREDLSDVDSPIYSHAVRWRNNRRACRFFSDHLRQAVSERASKIVEQQLPPNFGRWAGLERAQYLETKIFLSQYLLSSQGDRVGMAHSVEGRFPFLDPRVVEFCTQLPSNLKLRGLTEKYLLKKLARRWLPKDIWQRPKRAYRAPIHRSFFSEPVPAYVRDLLSPGELQRTGWFNPAAVSALVKRIEEGKSIGETDDMALAGILSTQLLDRQFVTDFRPPPPLSGNDSVKMCFGPNYDLQ
jgi:asparagine synthase (glutamine-hydrolysing)